MYSIDVVARAGIGVDTLRAVDYLRVSTEEQAKGFGISYTGKRTANHIRKKGWEHVRTYADEGVSGSLDHTERPDLKDLMRDAQQSPRPLRCRRRARRARHRPTRPRLLALGVEARRPRHLRLHRPR
ncbi:recombinase family protein [Streptomyces sp. NPDC006172]|uniref:recombinase family protein n=1 Tax=Streptomyces sp. NPDC006172 TaxID=3154470 RepID=UPI003407F18C